MKSRVALRQEIRTLLQKGDYPELVNFAGREPNVAGLLMQFLYEPQDPLHWRALEGLGHVAQIGRAHV